MQLFGNNAEKAPRAADPNLVRVGYERVETLKRAFEIAMIHDQPAPVVEAPQQVQPVATPADNQIDMARRATEQAYGSRGDNELAA